MYEVSLAARDGGTARHNRASGLVSLPILGGFLDRSHRSSGEPISCRLSAGGRTRQPETGQHRGRYDGSLRTARRTPDLGTAEADDRPRARLIMDESVASLHGVLVTRCGTNPEQDVRRVDARHWVEVICQVLTGGPLAVSRR